MTLRYLLDEHIPHLLIRALRQRDAGVVAWRIGQPGAWRIGQPGAPPLEIPDPELLVWCEVHDSVLITNNRATMPTHLASHLAHGVPVPGIFVVDLTLSITAIAEDLWLAAAFSLPDEYRDQLRYLPFS